MKGKGMNSKTITALVVIVFIGAAVIAIVLVNSKTKHETAMSHMHIAHNDSSSLKNVPQNTNQITYKGFAVAQPSIKVKKGTTVTWTNQDDAMHNVTPDTETADFKAGPLFGKGETYKATFNTVGTYAYHCSPHPYMKGVIEVIQ
jgi:amicyanin